MPEPATLAVFGVASFVLLVVPGPAVTFIVARSLQGGRAVGLASVAGLHVGTLVHVAAAALGLSALLVSSATAFSVVRYLGAAYLIYLGIAAWREPAPAASAASAASISPPQALRQGVVVQLLNPKLAVFFLAFLPQFVDPTRGAAGLQIALLGLAFIVLGLCTDAVYAVAAAAAASRLRRAGWFVRHQNRVTGSVYLALGVAAALVAPARREA